MPEQSHYRSPHKFPAGMKGCFTIETSMEEALAKFLEDSIQKLSKAKIDQDNDESLRSSFDYTEQAYRNILEKINWLKKTSALKQGHRILQLAKDREQDLDVGDLRWSNFAGQ